MKSNRLTIAITLCAIACLPIYAQDPLRCKVESSYDRFTDTTRNLCTVQRVDKLNISAVAAFKGKQGTDEAQYSLLFSYFDTEALRGEGLRYDQAETLYILAGDYRRQLPLEDYQHSTSPPLRNRVLRIERLTARLDRETLSRMMRAHKVELRLGSAEIELTDEALILLRDFFQQVEQPKQ